MGDIKDFPSAFIKRAEKIFPPGQFSKIMREGYLSPKIPTIRVNTLKTSIEDVQKYFLKNKISFEQDRYIPTAFFLKDISHRKTINLDLVQEGKIYLQNYSSQIPPLVLLPQPNQMILDLCASPGSKTTQMAALINNNGKIEACESDKLRFDRLNHNCHHLGATSVYTHLTRGEKFCDTSENLNILFDSVLADVPCSGDGTFYVNERASFTHWSEEFPIKCQKIQLKLLQSALKVLKKEGRLVYSTCSISPEENESVITSILNNNKELNLINVKNRIKLPFLQPCLKQWQGEVFHPQIQNCARIYPSTKTEGFFIACFEKS